jgi:hypothetical protein
MKNLKMKNLKKNLKKKLATPATLLIVSLFLLAGCGSTRVVFVDTGADMVRIGPNVTGKCYVLKNGEWVLSKNKIKLPEGWYAGGIPKE